MKTVKNILFIGLVTLSMVSFANNERITNKEGNVTITQNSSQVEVSVLNTENAKYQLFIYSENGDLVFKGTLGKEVSLGKAFDFKTAENGVYTFKVVSNTGAKVEKEVKIG